MAFIGWRLDVEYQDVPASKRENTGHRGNENDFRTEKRLAPVSDDFTISFIQGV
jgi:hypothetical protein